MVNTEIRLIIFFAAKDGEALYSQQKQDQELNLGLLHCRQTLYHLSHQGSPIGLHRTIQLQLLWH